VVVALRSIRRRPLGNSLIILGVAAAATGSGLAGLGAAGTALGIAVGAALLYAGFVLPAALRPELAPLPD
jgi:Flp pilus assembly protein protease CpaA